MKKIRLATAISAVAFLLLPAASPALAAQTRWDCADPLGAAYEWAGRLPLTGSNESGVFAHFDGPTDQDFIACNRVIDDGGSVSAWVALIPGVGNPFFGAACDGNNGCPTIVQIGILSGSGSQGGSFPATPPHYFYALGGCPNGSGGTYQPFAVDLGVANYADHTYRIDYYTGGNGAPATLQMAIDGNYVVTITSIDTRWPKFSCWINGTRDFNISAERHDRADNVGWYYGTGGLGANPPVFWDMKRKYQNTWYSLSGSTCDGNAQIDPNGPHPLDCDAQGSWMQVMDY